MADLLQLLSSKELIQMSRASKQHYELYEDILKAFEEKYVKVTEEWSYKGCETTYDIGMAKARFFDHAPLFG